MLVHHQNRPQGDQVVGLQRGVCCWCPPLLHWTSLHVIGFFLSSEYPSGFVCNDGHSLSQYMISVRLCQISPTTLLVPWFPGSYLSHHDTISRFQWFKGPAALIKILLLNLLFFFQHSLNFTGVERHWLQQGILKRNDSSCATSHKQLSGPTQSPGIGVFRNSRIAKQGSLLSSYAFLRSFLAVFTVRPTNPLL